MVAGWLIALTTCPALSSKLLLATWLTRSPQTLLEY
jgi:hypothetical protein